jgi:hypothetical protein
MSTTDDERLAIEFLFGRTVQKNGKPFREYLEPNSARERKAKWALVRLLMDQDKPLHPDIRTSLALLLVPTRPTRALVIRENRRAGKQPYDFRSDLVTSVAKAVLVHGKVTLAVEETAQRFGVENGLARLEGDWPMIRSARNWQPNPGLGKKHHPGRWRRSG